MRKFTLKDFMKYGDICFECDSPMKLKFERINLTDESRSKNVRIIKFDKNCLDLDLHLKYFDSLVMRINCSNHKFEVSDKKQFDNYQNIFQLRALTICDKCNINLVKSNYLMFDNLGFLHPISLYRENINIPNVSYDGKIRYYNIFTDFNKDITQIYEQFSQEAINIPAISLYKYKNKDKLLEKIKLLFTFS
jgi:hypothetical protein